MSKIANDGLAQDAL